MPARMSRIAGALTLGVAVVFIAEVRADELRGMWVNGWDPGFQTQSQVDQLLGVPGNPSSKGDIRNGNCNAVFVQVRRRADVAYPSQMGEPYMSGLSPANFNALQAIIDAAHDTTGGKQRIEVHCWIVAFKTAKGQVYSQHSDTANPDNYWPTRLSSVTGKENSDGAFDPGHPKCLQYLVNVAMDLVNNFDIDGIHYDYIRFEAATEGFNPTSVARYKTRYGLTADPASSNAQFQQWRRDQVSAYVRQVYARIQASKPWVKQSNAGITWHPAPASSTRAAFQSTRAYYEVYSDWDSWMEEGILDMAVPMAYFDWAGSYTVDYTQWMNFLKDRKFNRHAIIGPGLYLNSLANAIYELQITRDPSPAGNYAQGYNGYEYREPYKGGNWAAFQPSLVAQVNPSVADIPAMPWKTAPTKGHIMGMVTLADTGAWADHATVALAGPTSRSMYVDGTGFYAFIDLPPGNYTVTAHRAGLTDATATLNVAIGQLTGNMYQQDLHLGVTTSPTISNVQAVGLTDHAATITWTTDSGSSSRVEYGLTTAYGNSTTTDPTSLTSHSVPLASLIANSLYHFRVISTNDYGTTTSGDYTFTTSGPPTINNVQASPTGDGATISWNTTTPSSSQVRYGLTAGYGSQTTLAPAEVISHTVVLTGLASTTSYHFQVISANAYGSDQSGDNTFTTLGLPVISGVAATGITATAATITWTTDVAADSQVEYGATASYGSSSSLNSAMVTSHGVPLTGLTADTLYHYRVRSANTAGTVYSGDATFTTSAFNGEVIVDNTDSGFAYLLGSSWTIGTSSNKYGTNYFSCGEASSTDETAATHKACWTPNLPLSGTWDVYIWYARGANRTTNSYWKIINAGATRNLRVNQELNGNGWTLLSADVPFNAGTSGNVQMWNNTGSTGSGQVVQGDAVRFVFKAGDSQPPTVPANPAATAVSTSAINLIWDLSTDDFGVSGYKVYRAGTLIAQPATNGYLDNTALAANTTYAYQVSAYDNAGNESARGAVVTATTWSPPPGPSDVTPHTTTPCVNADVAWTAVGGFGSGKVQYYRYAWDQNSDHTFAGSEPTWSSGMLTVTPTTQGTWNLHVQGHNAADAANGSYTYSVMVNARSPADLDGDCDVDDQDFQVFTSCGLGAAVPYDPDYLPEGCVQTPDGQGRLPADFDRDGDIDQSDFGILQRCYGGPDAPVDPACAN